MKEISLKMSANFKVSLLNRNNVYQLENNSTAIKFETEVDEAMTYKLHIVHAGEKNVLLLDKYEDGVRANLTAPYIASNGIYYVQVEGLKDDFRIISNQIRLEIGSFINAEHIPTPEEQSIIDQLAIRVSALGDEVSTATSDVASMKATVEVVESTISAEIRAREEGDEALTGAIASKQDRLIPGENISIENNIISADSVKKSYVDGELSKKQDISAMSAYAKKTDIPVVDVNKQYVDAGLSLKQNKLTAGENITIEGDVISAVGGGSGDVTKAYVDEQDQKILDKVEELELFKTPNVTIVGTPTFNQGQASGFSDSSYLKFPFLVDFKSQRFEINMAFTTGSNVNQQENIFDSDFGLAFAIRSGRFVIAISTNGTNWDLGEGVGTHQVQPNTTYYVRLAWDKSQYILGYSFDGSTYSTDIVKAGTAQPFPKQIYIGVGENFASIMNHFTGTINLNKSTVKINGEVFWQGMDDAGLSTRLDTSLSNIDSDGVDEIKLLVRQAMTDDTTWTEAEQIAAQKKLGILSTEGVKF